MAVPKKRTSASRRDKRKANWELVAPTTVECGHCHALILPHRVCPECGWYGGKQVVKVEEK